MNGYDLGAKYYADIPDAPAFFEILESEMSEQITVRWTNPRQTVRGNPLDTLSSIQIWRNDSLIAHITQFSGQDTLEYVDVIPRPDNFRYQICAVDTSIQKGRMLYCLYRWMGGPIAGTIIWELDPTPISSEAIKNSLQSLGYQKEIYIGNNASRYPIEPTVDAIFVCLGIYNNNHVLSEYEAIILKDYLDNGGNVYMEGGDTWFYDTLTTVHPYFQIVGTDDGGADLFDVHGQPLTPFSELQFSYSGENNWMDHIEPTGLSQKILYNPSENCGVGVAYAAPNYNTIGTSFEFGGLDDGTYLNTKEELMNRILDFFGVSLTGIQASRTGFSPTQFVLKQNYPNPFNSTTIIGFGLPSGGEVSVSIYNILGQRIYGENLGNFSGGWHLFTWTGMNHSHMIVSSGIYIYLFSFIDNNGKKWTEAGKMYLMK